MPTTSPSHAPASSSATSDASSPAPTPVDLKNAPPGVPLPFSLDRLIFFNGRFLNANDLSLEQKNQLLRAALSERAQGAGVSFGFHVATGTAMTSPKFVDDVAKSVYQLMLKSKADWAKVFLQRGGGTGGTTANDARTASETPATFDAEMIKRLSDAVHEVCGADPGNLDETMFLVGPGHAADGYGHDLYLEAPQKVKLSSLVASFLVNPTSCTTAGPSITPSPIAGGAPPLSGPFLLCAYLNFEDYNNVPVYGVQCGGDEAACSLGNHHEGVGLALVQFPAATKDLSGTFDPSDPYAARGAGARAYFAKETKDHPSRLPDFVGSGAFSRGANAPDVGTHVPIGMVFLDNGNFVSYDEWTAKRLREPAEARYWLESLLYPSKMSQLSRVLQFQSQLGDALSDSSIGGGVKSPIPPSLWDIGFSDGSTLTLPGVGFLPVSVTAPKNGEKLLVGDGDLQPALDQFFDGVPYRMVRATAGEMNAIFTAAIESPTLTLTRADATHKAKGLTGLLGDAKRIIEECLKEKMSSQRRKVRLGGTAGDTQEVARFTAGDLEFVIVQSEVTAKPGEAKSIQMIDDTFLVAGGGALIRTKGAQLVSAWPESETSWSVTAKVEGATAVQMQLQAVGVRKSDGSRLSLSDEYLRVESDPGVRAEAKLDADFSLIGGGASANGPLSMSVPDEKNGFWVAVGQREGLVTACAVGVSNKFLRGAKLDVATLKGKGEVTHTVPKKAVVLGGGGSVKGTPTDVLDSISFDGTQLTVSSTGAADAVVTAYALVALGNVTRSADAGGDASSMDAGGSASGDAQPMEAAMPEMAIHTLNPAPSGAHWGKAIDWLGNLDGVLGKPSYDAAANDAQVLVFYQNEAYPGFVMFTWPVGELSLAADDLSLCVEVKLRVTPELGLLNRAAPEAAAPAPADIVELGNTQPASGTGTGTGTGSSIRNEYMYSHLGTRLGATDTVREFRWHFRDNEWAGIDPNLGMQFDSLILISAFRISFASSKQALRLTYRGFDADGTPVEPDEDGWCSVDQGAFLGFDVALDPPSSRYDVRYSGRFLSIDPKNFRNGVLRTIETPFVQNEDLCAPQRIVMEAAGGEGGIENEVPSAAASSGSASGAHTGYDPTLAADIRYRGNIHAGTFGTGSVGGNVGIQRWRLPLVAMDVRVVPKGCAPAKTGVVKPKHPFFNLGAFNRIIR